MKRRDAIKYTAISFGALISQSTVLPLLANSFNQLKDHIESYKLKHFSVEEFELLSAIMDTILPETDSPSATQVGVHFLMDSMIAEVFPVNDRDGFMRVFTALKDHLKSESFLEADDSTKLELLTATLSHKTDNHEDVYWGADAVRSFAIELYLATEIIGEEYQNYSPVPGYYDPCIDVSEVNNIRWSI